MEARKPLVRPTLSGLTFFRVRGIPLRLHWTLGAMVLYLAWVFSMRFAEMAQKSGPGVLPPLGWGLLVSVGLFVGVALHELGHSLLALAFGGKVRAITLTFIGGVSEIEEMPRHGMREALVAFAGPLVSFLLAGVAWLAMRATSSGTDVNLGLSLLARLNLVIGIFNLLPAFPLDGGRVLRSLLEARWNRLRATQVAAGVSKGLAVALALLGLLGNWMLLVIALFLWMTADAELRSERLRAALRDVRVYELLDAEPDAKVEAEASVAEVAQRMVAQRQLSFVVTSGPRIVGRVNLARIKRVPPEERPSLPVRAVADPLPEIDAESPVEEAMRRMEQAGASSIVVTSMGDVVGMLSRDAVLRAIELGELATPPNGRRATWPWPPVHRES
jgi:Zn-dependent protease/CBS domain-containing protein